jgi:hypothetical protein
LPRPTSSPTYPLLQVQPFLIGGGSLLCDWSTGRPCPLIPDGVRQAVFDAVHSLAHPGICSTGDYYWQEQYGAA